MQQDAISAFRKNLNDLEEIVMQAKRVPLSNMCMVDRERILGLANAITTDLPTVFAECEGVVQNQITIISEANERAEQTKQNATMRANQYVTDAKNQAQQMTAQAQQQAQEMLGQRIYDLQIAENIALQTIPMIQGIQYSNFNLSRKINSAFIITLPIFKQCLTQAVMLKRQELQAKSMEALDQKTNELLLRNAENMANQNARIARMATGSSVQIETLEKTWQTIMKGIEQTKAIEEENRNARQNNAVKLENMKQSILKTTGHEPR